MDKVKYESPEIDVLAVSYEEDIFQSEKTPDPWGGEGAGDEPTPGF